MEDITKVEEQPATTERLAYSVQESVGIGRYAGAQISAFTD